MYAFRQLVHGLVNLVSASFPDLINSCERSIDLLGHPPSRDQINWVENLVESAFCFISYIRNARGDDMSEYVQLGKRSHFVDLN